MIDLSKMSDAELEAIASGKPPAMSVDPDTDFLVRTVWGEARGEPALGRKAVASVIRNRAKLTGRPIRDVVLAPGQFEPWGDPKTRAELEALDPASEDYRAILRDIEGDDDPTQGATHFYSPVAQAALGRKPPAWDDGSGFDLGGHRFFRRANDFGQAPEQPAPVDIEGMSDEELARIAGEAPEPDFLGEVQFTAAEGTAMRPGKGFIDARTGENLNERQAATYAALAKEGKLDPNASPGSAAFPLAQRNPEDAPKPGDWYVTVDGVLRQEPEVPWTGAALNLAGSLMGGAIGEMMVPDDRRTAAIKRAGGSGLLLGGRNELVAALESLPEVVKGGIPALQERFGDVLRREDAASAEARRDFPIMYDATAATTALGSGLMMPAGRLATATIGGAGGFLSTDGDLGDRALGAGLGAAGGEVLRYVAPRVAGSALEAAGIPTRRAGPAEYSPLTGLPMREGATPQEIRVAGALERAGERDTLLTPQVAAAARDAGVMPIYEGGDNLAGLAELLAQSPGPGQRIVRQAVRDQQAGVPARVKSAISETFGSGDYFERLGEMRAARREAAEKGMETLGRHEVTLDRNSVDALRSDLARSAIREQAINSLASPDPEIRDAGARLNRLYDDLLDKPSAQTITVRDAQNISKSLLDAADDAFRSGNGSRGKALKDLGKSVRENAATPERGGFSEYGEWLRQYGEDSSAIEALELGRGVFGNKLDMSASNLRKTFAGWSDAAKENYRAGVAEALLDQVRRKGGIAEARQLLKNEEFADRIRVAVPDSMSFDDFMSALEREVAAADRNNRIVGGSPTYARAAGRADLEAQSRDPLDMAAEAIDTGLSPLRLTGKALKEALKAIPRKDRSILGDPQANEALARALTDPDEMTRLLNLLEGYRARRDIPLRGVPGRVGAQAGAELATPERPR